MKCHLDFASTSRRLAQMWKNLPIADQEVGRLQINVYAKLAVISV